MHIVVQETVITEASGGKARRTDHYVHKVEIPLEDLFTPCTPEVSLLERTSEPAENAAAGDVNLSSPDCSSFDRFAKANQQRSKALSRSLKTTGGGGKGRNPNINDKVTSSKANRPATSAKRKVNFDSGFCEGKPWGKKTTPTSLKGRHPRQ